MTTSCVQHFDFLSMSDADIKVCIQQYGLALSTDELIKIQSLLQRPPTLAECILWGIQASEHCSYKSTRKYLKTLCTTGPNVISGAKEDAGIVWVAKDHAENRYCVAISHESHNHPSQVVPFEGAATGIGGNVRDVSCMGAEVIANADSLCFGAPSWISDEVVRGIASYSNAIGVPNIAGDIYFDPAFSENCLVTVVSLGLVREDHIIHSCAPKNADNYVFILVGKATDSSGFGGASFASADLDSDDVENNRAAVQEPNAFLGRVLLKANHDLFKKLQTKNLIQSVGMKDLGAGGIACASVELAESGGYGADIFLETVPTSQKNLDPSVMLCSETQERYMWVVPPDLAEFILHHYNHVWRLPEIALGAKAAVVGKIRTDQRYVVHYHDEIIVSAKASDITRGIVYDRPIKEPNKKNAAEIVFQQSPQSCEFVYEQYDKQVQGRTIVERGVADAGVLQPFNSSEYPQEIRLTGIALSVDCNPAYGKIDPYWTAVNAVASSVCKVIAVGATPWCLTDCLCFGNPENPEQMGELVSSIRGIKEASEQIGLLDFENTPIPIVAGNVSLYNQNKNGKAIPASPMISCLGRMDDVRTVLTPRLRYQDSVLVCVGQRIDVLPKPDLFLLRRAAKTFFVLHARGWIVSAKAIDHDNLGWVIEVLREYFSAAEKILQENEINYRVLRSALALGF